MQSLPLPSAAPLGGHALQYWLFLTSICAHWLASYTKRLGASTGTSFVVLVVDPSSSKKRTSGHESGFAVPPWCSPLKRCPVQPAIVQAVAKEIANCRLQASEKSNKYQRRLRAISIGSRRTRTESRGIRLPFPR